MLLTITQSYNSALNWTITDLGNRIAILLVYARLRDADSKSLCSGLSLSDDIIYDPLAPTVTLTIPSTSKPTTRTSRLANVVTLILAAADQPGGSGVADMQFSTNQDFGGARWQPYSATAQISAQPGQTVYARVRDGAGNMSSIASVKVSGDPAFHTAHHSIR